MKKVILVICFVFVLFIALNLPTTSKEVSPAQNEKEEVSDETEATYGSWGTSSDFEDFDYEYDQNCVLTRTAKENEAYFEAVSEGGTSKPDFEFDEHYKDNYCFSLSNPVKLVKGDYNGLYFQDLNSKFSIYPLVDDTYVTIDGEEYLVEEPMIIDYEVSNITFSEDVLIFFAAFETQTITMTD